MKELDAEVKKAGIVVMNEIGLDPGIDHLYAVKTISEVHEKGGKEDTIFFYLFFFLSLTIDLRHINQFWSYCGGLPVHEFSGNPLGYKFS